jgi:hypothetical protein
MKPLEQLILYLERRISYASQDLALGVMPGVQDSIELEKLKVRIEELRVTLNFVKNLDSMYPLAQSAPSSSE